MKHWRVTRPMPARPATPPRSSVLGRVVRSDGVSGWALVSPAVVLIGIFGLLPVLMSLQLSFQQSDLLTPETPWVGLENYRKLADDPVFLEAIKNTIVYTALFVPGTMVVGLGPDSRLSSISLRCKGFPLSCTRLRRSTVRVRSPAFAPSRCRCSGRRTCSSSSG
jgi:hypothetical protein